MAIIPPTYTFRRGLIAKNLISWPLGVPVVESSWALSFEVSPVTAIPTRSTTAGRTIPTRPTWSAWSTWSTGPAWPTTGSRRTSVPARRWTVVEPSAALVAKAAAPTPT